MNSHTTPLEAEPIPFNIIKQSLNHLSYLFQTENKIKMADLKTKFKQIWTQKENYTVRRKVQVPATVISFSNIVIQLNS